MGTAVVRFEHVRAAACAMRSTLGELGLGRYIECATGDTSSDKWESEYAPLPGHLRP